MKDLIEPAVPRRTLKRMLCASDYQALHALLQVLAGDEEVSEEVVKGHVDRRIDAVPGALLAYGEAVELLDRRATKMFDGRTFAALDMGERDSVLRSILRRYPHEHREPKWRWRLRVTSENLDVVSAPRRIRRFRLHVVRDLLGLYYRSPRGWSTVGLDRFPGYIPEERKTGEVVALHVDPEEGAVMQLADGTSEVLAPRSLRPHASYGLVVKVKSGRQKARFSRLAYQQLMGLLGESAEEIVVHAGPRPQPALDNDVREGIHD